MPREFVCCECGRPVISLIRREPESYAPLCAHCLTIPGWFRVAAMRRIIDRRHSGREADAAIAAIDERTSAR